MINKLDRNTIGTNIIKNLNLNPKERPGKKRMRRGQSHKHMNTHPDIATDILNRPRGRFSEKDYYPFNFSDKLFDLKSPVNAVRSPAGGTDKRQTHKRT